VLGYTLHDIGSIPGKGRDFFFVTTSRPILGSTQYPIQWVPGIFPTGQSGRGVKLYLHSPIRLNGVVLS